jgi:hypothetical protein
MNVLAVEEINRRQDITQFQML